MSDFRRGDQVVFFHGRSPKRGQVEEVQEDDRIVVLIKTDGGLVRMLKDDDELKKVEDVQGKHAVIRFK